MGTSLFINMGPKSKKSYTCTKYLVNVLEKILYKKDYHRIWEVKITRKWPLKIIKIKKKLDKSTIK